VGHFILGVLITVQYILCLYCTVNTFAATEGYGYLGLVVWLCLRVS